MIPLEASIQMAHALLSAISGHTQPTYRMFYQDYRSFFSIVKVPPVKEIYNKNGDVIFVDVDKQQAVDYLKHKFNFYDSNEITQILQEEAEHHGIRPHTE